ncbi:unnamed protein product [Calicophoron daubneyi]|uniref:Pseudouridylate synthase 1 homolog n=1 Tax=Calicophoron daubneyi TaxID=300641 RepID=A0AAV2TKV8_CALDB
MPGRFSRFTVVLQKIVMSVAEKIENLLPSKRPLPDTQDCRLPAKSICLDSALDARKGRKMFAILMMYSGWGYYGMQRSPTFPTIEGELGKALVTCGYMNNLSGEEYKNAEFQRASKTDKSVSALGQVCCMLLPADEDVKSRLNEALPSHIRILDVIRSTRRFSPKRSCSHRVYDYLFPTFALAPLDLPGDDVGHWSYRVSAERLTRTNEILGRFVGTRNYYNFTSGRAHTDRSCNRYIISAECMPPFLYGDHEYAIVRIVGQSFVLHQIRKMIGLMIAIVRGHTTEAIFDTVFTSDRIDVPKAPALGLMLNRVDYTVYNKKFGEDGIHQAIDWSKYEEEIARFKSKFVYDHIAKVEVEERSMLEWLAVLPKHRYMRELSVQPSSPADSPSPVPSKEGNVAQVDPSLSPQKQTSVEDEQALSAASR